MDVVEVVLFVSIFCDRAGTDGSALAAIVAPLLCFNRSVGTTVPLLVDVTDGLVDKADGWLGRVLDGIDCGGCIGLVVGAGTFGVETAFVGGTKGCFDSVT